MLSTATAQSQSDWATSESIRGSLELLERFDSSGPDAWDAAAHPMVYFTSEGVGYNPLRGENRVGFHIIDGYTKEAIASALYDLGEELGSAAMDSPHDVGVSPDGRWIYLGFRDRPAGASDMRAVLLVVNARTLKMDMALVMPQGQRAHHITAFTDWEDRHRMLVNGGRFLYVSVVAPAFRSQVPNTGGIAKLNLETGASTIIPAIGDHPIGMAHTADGRYTYVNEGHHCRVYKIDNETNTVVGNDSAGVAGPYGLALNWDESRLFTVGKGEGSHNTRGVLGVIDARIFSPLRGINQPLTLGGSGARPPASTTPSSTRTPR